MNPFFRARSLAAISFFVTLAALRAPERDCEDSERGAGYAAPILVAPVAVGRPVILAEDAVLASETLQLSTRGLVLAEPLRVAMDPPLLFPAGTPLDRVNAMQTFEGDCLPIVPPTLAPDPESAWRRGTGLLVCPVDDDKDGRFDRVDLHDTDFRMHVPHVGFIRSIPLSPPLAMREDPQGLERGRAHAHRRVRVGRLGPDSAELRIERSWHGLDMASSYDFFPGQDGSLEARLTAAVHPAEPEGDALRYGSDQSVTIALRDGIFQAGGLGFRLARRGAGWTMTPLAARFEPWIRYECDRRRVVLDP